MRDHRLLPLVAVAVLSAGCSLRRMAVDQTAEILAASGAAVNEETDLEYAEAAIPGGLLTIEGLWRNAQDNETLLLQLAQNYSGYAFGFIEDRAEAALARDDQEEADHQYRRARRFYLRGRRYGLYLLELRHEGFGAKMRSPLEQFEAYLRDEMDEDDVPALFWTAYGWASAINVAKDDMTLVAELPIPLAIVKRVNELDPTFYGHSPTLFMANVYAGFPAALGGEPERGRQLYERVIRVTREHDLLPIYMLAQTYAVSTQNRTLFVQLLRKVIESPNADRSKRLTNAIARRRAARLLARVDELF